MRARLLLKSVGMVAGVLSLVVSCSGTGVLIPDGFEELSKCEVRQYEADELPALGEPECDLEGSSVLLPDRTLVRVPELGGVVVESPDASQGTGYHSVNWGVPGDDRGRDGQRNLGDEP